MATLQDAMTALANGDSATALQIADLHTFVDPYNEQAWLIKMQASDDPVAKAAAARRVLQINPDNAMAQQVVGEGGGISAAKPATDADRAAETARRTYTKPDGTRVEELGTYEMLWDCEFCGTNKLLGHSQRYCGNCGAQQNPEKRYFPSDEEKVAVRDHQYYGVDVICTVCETLNTAEGEFCVNCGSPLTEGKSAETLTAEKRAEGAAFTGGQSRDLVRERFEAQMAAVSTAAAPPSKTSGGLGFLGALGIGSGAIFVLGMLCCVAAICAPAVFLLTRTTESSVVVSGHEWERRIEIETFGAVSDGDWCNQMPNDAYNVRRSERQDGSRQVADGETCETVRVDNGDGTFSERRECTTNYRSEPIYRDYCDYMVDRWSVADTVSVDGASLSDALAWPQLSLSGSDEREGDRREIYTVVFRDSESNERYECEFDDERTWRRYTMESRWVLSLNFAGSPLCDSLEPAN